MEPISGVRSQLIRDYFLHITNLREQVHISYWSDHHLLIHPLFELLPFGRIFTPTQFYQYVDYQHPNLIEQASRNLLYWSLVGARESNGQPATQISLFFDDTFFWHYYVPAKAQEIKTNLRNGNRIRFLSRFHLSQAQIEVEYNEIRLLSEPGSEDQFVFTDAKDYTYNWTQQHWNITVNNHEFALINPNLFTLPISEPNNWGRQSQYLDQLDRILSQPQDLSVSAQYWDSVDSSQNLTEANTPDLLPTDRNVPLPELVSCICGIDICYCSDQRPDTPPTPPGITLWKPIRGSQPVRGIHYQRNPRT